MTAGRLGLGLLAMLIAVTGAPLPALGAGAVLKVGTGTPASCTEAALVDALLDAEVISGSTIRFRCGRAPVTIVVNRSLMVPDNTTIDGERSVTLLGTFGPALFVVDFDKSATVRRMTISNSISAGILNFGTLTVADVTFDDTFGVCGGGISSHGTLRVRNSTFKNNVGFFQGGALCNTGTASVHNSTFSDNVAVGGGNGGGAVWNSGVLHVAKSIFTHNSTTDPGGAIYSSGTLTVNTSIFFQNTGGGGGAIFNDGDLTVRNTVMLENAAANGFWIGAGHGGGIDNRGDLDVTNTLITGNTSIAAGGGLHSCCGGTTRLRNTVVIGNEPDNIVLLP